MQEERQWEYNNGIWTANSYSYDAINMIWTNQPNDDNWVQQALDEIERISADMITQWLGAPTLDPEPTPEEGHYIPGVEVAMDAPIEALERGIYSTVGAVSCIVLLVIGKRINRDPQSPDTLQWGKFAHVSHAAGSLDRARQLITPPPNHGPTDALEICIAGGEVGRNTLPDPTGLTTDYSFYLPFIRELFHHEAPGIPAPAQRQCTKNAFPSNTPNEDRTTVWVDYEVDAPDEYKFEYWTQPQVR